MHLFSIFLPIRTLKLLLLWLRFLCSKYCGNLRKSNDVIFAWRNIESSISWNMNVKNCEFCKDYVNDWIWDHLFAINLLQKLANRKSNMQNIINFNSIIIFKICQKSTSTPLPSYSHAINSFDEWDRTVFIADRKSVVRVL